MAFDPISAGFSLVDTLVGAVSKYFDNQSKAELAKIDIQRIVAEHLREVDRLQIELNKAEAASGDKYASRWRPTLGWMGVVAVAYQYFLTPIVNALIQAFTDSMIQLPVVDLEWMITLLAFLVGYGGVRTFEKMKGINS